VAYSPIKASSKGGGKDFELVPAGTHFAICIGIYYLGVQAVTFEGETKEQPKVYFRFEIPDIQIEYEKNGQKVKGPAIIGREFTLNIGDKSNLGPFIANWRGKEFTKEEAEEYDVTSLLGKVCNLGVIHKTKGDKTYANISSAGKILKIQQDSIVSGTLSAEPHNPLMIFNADSPDPEVYEKLPKFLKQKIDNRITTTKTGKPLDAKKVDAREPGSDDEFDDQIPF
jgi:hypothetical protein